jgi:proteasome accessory factor A
VLADGKSADAVELLFIYQQKARKLFEGRDSETDALLKTWEDVLEGLSSKPESMVGMLDWITKEYLLREFCRSEKLEWGHPWLESQDLEFHHIDADQSLGLALANRNGFWEPKGLKEAMLEPPKDSRAHARSRLMREIQGKESSYFLDWEAVEVPNQKRTRLLNPFQP